MAGQSWVREHRALLALLVLKFWLPTLSLNDSLSRKIKENNAAVAESTLFGLNLSNSTSLSLFLGSAHFEARKVV
jgi:hypothetical protein